MPRSAPGRSSLVAPGAVRDADWIYGDRAASERRVHEPPQTVSEAETIVRDAELKAAQILAQAQKDREGLLEQARVSAERTVLELKNNAEEEAAAIVQDAELKAGEALIGVEHARARLHLEMQEVAREQASMAAKQEQLSEFLLTALDEIERASANGSANVDGLQELRDELRSTE
jgi:F0F1-type ATP synthase membrane subunit b/b'